MEKYNFENRLKKIKSFKGKKCFSISNTSKKEPFFYTPIRIQGDFLVTGAVVENFKQAKEFYELAKDHFDYIALDDEIKVEDYEKGLSENSPLREIENAKLFKFKANDITLEAVDTFLSYHFKSLEGINIAIVGLGNIGFKLALKLIERGANIKAYRRDQQTLSAQTLCLDSVKTRNSGNIEAFKTIKDSLKEADVIIATANARDIIGTEEIKDL